MKPLYGDSSSLQASKGHDTLDYLATEAKALRIQCKMIWLACGRYPI